MEQYDTTDECDSWESLEQAMGTGKKWRRRCEGLTRICESTVWSADTDKVYKNIVDTVTDVLYCDETHMHLFDVDGNQFVKCASNVEIPESMGTVSSTIGRMQYLMKKRQPIVMDYLHPHEEDQIPAYAIEQGFRAAVSIPLVSGDNLLGMCSIVYKHRVTWSDEALEYLVEIGRVLGVAIQRMKTTKKAAELQILDERKKLSAEIHDNLAQKVVSLSLIAEMALMSYEDSDSDAVKDDLERLAKASKETTKIMRDEMLSLRVPLGETDGLVEGISECLENFQKQWHVKTSLDVRTTSSPLVIPLQVSLQITRIMNECLSNILYHAEAENVWVKFEEDGTNLVLEVCDDGHGFDVEAVPPERLGIRIMRERAVAAGGKLSISSDENGTIVRLIVKQSSWR